MNNRLNKNNTNIPKKKLTRKCQKQMKRCSKKYKTFIDFKKLLIIYNKELEHIKTMDNEELEKFESDINSKSEIEGESVIIDNLNSLMNSDNDNSKVTLNDIKEEIEKFKSVNNLTNIDNLPGCSNLYNGQTEIEDKDSWNERSKNYEIQKGDSKYFVKVLELDKIYKYQFEMIKGELDIYILGSNLHIIPEIHDIFVCEEDSKPKLIIMKEYIEGTSLNNYDIKSLTSRDMSNIEKLVNTSFDNNIVLNWLDEKNIMLLEDENGNPLKDENGDKIFKLLSLKNATKGSELLNTEKKRVLNSINWIGTKSDIKMRELCMKSIIRNKMFKFKL